MCIGKGASFEYNGQGKRTEKQTGTPGGQQNRTFYLCDEGGQVGTSAKLEPGSDALKYRSVVYIDQLPVGLIEQTSRGTTMLWRWELVTGGTINGGSNAFGESLANEDVEGNGIAYKFELRFPGQIHDPETGLHYNYFRDYEPGTGRYVESDPIGLKGGVSTYGYALVNPLRRTDPRGLYAHRPGSQPDRSTGGRPVCNGVMLTFELYWQEPCAEDCGAVHELSHVDDIRLTIPGLCHDNVGDEVRPIVANGMPEKIATEKRAYAKESACLRAKLGDMNCDDAFREKVRRRLDFVDDPISTMSYSEH